MNRAISKINFRKMRHEMLVQMVKNLLTAIDKYKAEEIGIKDAADALREAFEKMIPLLDFIFASPLTSQIHSQDRYREGILRGVINIARAALHHVEPGVRADAEAVIRLIKHYGSIARRSYDEESAAIDDLLRELNSADFAPRVATIGISSPVELLAAANDIFFDLMMKRDAETSARPKLSMRQARSAVEEKLDTLIACLEGIYALNGTLASNEYKLFLIEYNAIIDRYKLAIAQEKGARRAAAERKKIKTITEPADAVNEIINASPSSPTSLSEIEDPLVVIAEEV
ncbi:MAG: DUF6261 family protein [Odoribacteraceae bacterium]|nr:DUF6261 family protein [Odoribacteraceae bacterium]